MKLLLDSEPYDLRPSKIIGVGRNYRAHAEELGHDLPTEPLLFFKAPSALVAAGEPIVRPGGFERVDHEAELGVVIAQRARNVAAANALDIVLGYTCVNDVTVRDLQKRDVQFTRAKSFDSFCPVGPRIVSGLDPSKLAVECRVNGEVRQSSTTARMIFDVPTLIETITRVMTLEPGDLIATGTPAGVGQLWPGDRVEVEVEGIGVLANPVVAEDAASA